MGEKRIVRTTCRMCGSLCGIKAHIEDNKLVYVEGDEGNILSKGRICIKGSSAPTWLNLPDRLSKPLKKNQSGGFDEIELEQAMDEIGSRLAAIRQQYGPAAIGVWTDEDLDAGQNKEAAHRLAYALGSPNYFSSDSQYMASRAMSMSMVYGNYGSPDIANSRLLIIWGANPPFANPIKMQAINEARSKGAKLVVIDPCYTEIARQADLYIAIRPGTDGALAWGIIKEMLERGIVDYPFIKEFTLGFEQLQAYAVEFTRERVAEITDVNGDAIKQIVDLIAKAAPACCNYLGTGVEQHLNGSNTIRAIAFIDVLAGSIDRLGGVKLPEALGNATLLDDCECQQLRSLEPVGADVFPVFYEKTTAGHTSTLADQIVSAKPYPIKALILSAANPLLTNAATSRVQEALSALELLVVKDLFLTETAQLADYVIPAASWLERVEIVANPEENALFYADKCLDYGLQTEYQFYKGLAERLGVGQYFPWQDDYQMAQWRLAPTGYSMAQLQAQPGGFCCGSYQYEKHVSRKAKGEKPFNTPSGMIEFFSDYLETKQRPGLEGLPKYHLPYYQKYADNAYPLILLTGIRNLTTYQGRYRNIPQLNVVNPQGYLELHPDDAAVLGIKEGDQVKVSSRNGSINTYVRIRDRREIMAGVVRHTYGLDGANANLLTNDAPDSCDPVTGFPTLKSIAVKVEKM